MTTDSVFPDAAKVVADPPRSIPKESAITLLEREGTRWYSQAYRV